MFDVELAKTWVSGLRSGRYNQCRGRHKNNDGEFCAIGVLFNEIDHEAWRDTPGGYPIWIGPDLVEDIGFSAGYVEEIMWMNDEERFSFEEIADVIEANLEEQFPGVTLEY